MNTNEQFNPSNPVIIDHLILKTLTGVEVDIKNFMVEMNIYTSIFSTMHARLLIIDANAMTSAFPIIGGEEIKVKFATAGREQKTELKFIIRGLGDQLVDRSSRAIWLELETPDNYANTNMVLSRGYNDNYSGIFKRVLTELNTNRKSFVSESSGLVKLATPRWNPFKICHWLAQRAHDINNVPFIFYEDFDGYHFKPVGELLSGEIVDKFFHQDVGINEGAYKRFRNIDAMELVDRREAYQFREAGVEHRKDIIFDFRAKTFKGEVNNYLEKFGNIPNVDKYPIRSKCEKGDLEHWLYPYGDTGEMADYQRLVYNYLMGMTSLNIMVFGDNEIKLGGVYEFNMPSFSPTINDEKLSENLLSGRLLATHIKHSLYPNNYKMTIELVKDSYSSKLPEVKDGQRT